MQHLPETGFLRLKQILGDPHAKPPIPPLIPVKKTCWWEGVQTNKFPRPIKLASRVTVWRVEDIYDFIKSEGKIKDRAQSAPATARGRNSEGAANVE